ncbi:hypothetical protein ABB37_07962 [Leptomonas pyrrhocoris]|uniref:DUF306 domain-containing protein n=1 Tax=Leptomonas pyrrhocoris TaxID=157538 RepID=A0A0M9FUD6_LEPPY|nr:hypothetical protein ABB37_07962 [Leptomonas pyrrhocoris]XP_015654653.1 hypothetical protein ABB37_07962 [Leptomonas pyrrhocoris]KPA76213.1 hypothetical protein ABB37_07962 [Leptomonas pyrrhocoris]KPA76214.1 hypothetical protein ABB37_07962 [Leptomonas pyrrhocoris]|eukprot:XP_015654652.1 hypothetical protein ABB37_07962 [Leptomonas pyrrhocoris]
MKMSILFDKYNVEEFDSAPFTEHATVVFTKGEIGMMGLHAKVANVMSGDLHDQNHVLKGLVISTMMYGTETQMELERALSHGCDSGMAYKLRGGKVTLTTDSHTIVLTPQ